VVADEKVHESCGEPLGSQPRHGVEGAADVERDQRFSN
jgi:hypothetical protein